MVGEVFCGSGSGTVAVAVAMGSEYRYCVVVVVVVVGRYQQLTSLCYKSCMNIQHVQIPNASMRYLK
jgi:hypothetical protein